MNYYIKVIRVNYHPKVKTKLNLEPCKGQSVYSADSMKVQI